jgi:hypothetical protein
VSLQVTFTPKSFKSVEIESKRKKETSWKVRFFGIWITDELSQPKYPKRAYTYCRIKEAILLWLKYLGRTSACKRS